LPEDAILILVSILIGEEEKKGEILGGIGGEMRG